MFSPAMVDNLVAHFSAWERRCLLGNWELSLNKALALLGWPSEEAPPPLQVVLLASSLLAECGVAYQLADGSKLAAQEWPKEGIRHSSDSKVNRAGGRINGRDGQGRCSPTEPHPSPRTE